jgi:glycosyltransferase involved in cell wall biosynthesis
MVTPPEDTRGREFLTILIPAYNEAATIETALRRLWKVELPLDCETIVIDDASGDPTAELVERLRGESPYPLRLIRHQRNQGKTAALRSGLAQARGSLTLVYDADLEYDPADIPRLLAPVLDGRADAVYGSRFQSPERRVLFFWHALGNRLVTALANLFANLNLTDMETCFKLVRTDTLRRMRLRSERFGFEPEVTVKLGRLGERVYEVPIRYAGRSYDEGKKIRWWDALRAIGTILRAGLLETPLAEPEAARRWRRERLRRYHRELLGRLAPVVGPRVLVAGADRDGLLLNLLPSRRLLILDPDPDRITRLRARFSHRPNVTVQPWSPAQGRPETEGEVFDTVIAAPPGGGCPGTLPFTSEWAGLLAPGGHLVALLPAGPALAGEPERCRPDQARRMVEEAGLSLVRIAYFDLVGAVGYWCAARILGLKRVPPRWVTVYRYLQPLLLLERIAPPPVGRTLLVIARSRTPEPD